MSAPVHIEVRLTINGTAHQLTVDTRELCSGQDIDTPEDLEAIRNEARAVL